ncbi:hypothetical protein Scep_010001 [Stephania cephalantha]|uniref:Uncharacterized protein n=1 Tax=Stephania cephalantha TaxID=152367 RepID=A0AAP0PGN8_9MAGN
MQRAMQRKERGGGVAEDDDDECGDEIGQADDGDGGSDSVGEDDGRGGEWGLAGWFAQRRVEEDGFCNFNYFPFCCHLWHARRACAAEVGFGKGIDCDLEPVLFMTPLN